jgi:hypothetical protein
MRRNDDDIQALLGNLLEGRVRRTEMRARWQWRQRSQGLRRHKIDEAAAVMMAAFNELAGLESALALAAFYQSINARLRRFDRPKPSAVLDVVDQRTPHDPRGIGKKRLEQGKLGLGGRLDQRANCGVPDRGDDGLLKRQKCGCCL